jgi:hypothetical protein
MAVADHRQPLDQLVKWAGKVQDEVIIAQRLILNEIGSIIEESPPRLTGCHKMAYLCGS